MDLTEGAQETGSRGTGDREARELRAQLQVQAILSVLITVTAGCQLSRFYFLETEFLFVGVQQVLSVGDFSF